VITSFFFVGDQVLFKVMLTESFSVNDTPLYLLLGLFAGLVSVYFHKVHFAITGFFQKIRSKAMRLAIGGLFIGAMLFAIPPLYGEGFSVINNLLASDHQSVIEGSLLNRWADSPYVVIVLLIGITLFKSVVMTTTIAAGGTGGIIIPALVMGSSLGNAVAKLINQLGFTHEVSEANFTLVGMAAILAGVLQAPLTAIFLIAEITGGYALFIPLMLAVSMAYLITKNSLNHTIYTKELAEKDALLSFDKDQSVLTLMTLDSVIETNFVVLRADMTFRELLQKGVAQSSRNLFPVVDESEQLVGIILLDDIRPFLFDQTVYDKTTVMAYMTRPPETISYEKDSMQKVMQRFQDSGAWNLPVLKAGKYAGFVSKSKLLTAYRRELINFTN
jgi:chloride channel protein, CIC family